ncbi:YgfZ/GcvT domain-containing protein [Aspergillus homomorphus CBS 101889]|uniref:Iron-sulfur cluster assembly factor IBA57 homolog, mitochondrial n=1 Tax=Aspergillus homomorphus (strain CBS 101889) TaxID=1450537 RepID=A0A395I940_ASPHC|nr:Aminomethyltransferase folate-binding domain-containing protein [Aspergillus homomorphus CBS 101889]RAL14654.1 Aminomethyltransferase folate-binding domain-containing protein [Aspergillus homomorphus CBS 101889]
MIISNPTRTVCARCVSRSRYFSTTVHRNTSAPENANPARPPAAGYTRLKHRGLIHATGQDSQAFLQGLITQNMNTLDHEKKGSYAAFLNSQGRILNDAFIYPAPAVDGGPGWFIEAAVDQIPALVKRLKRHRLRSKVQIRALDADERTVWASWGENEREGRWATYSMRYNDSDGRWPMDRVLGCEDTRAPGFGLRILAPDTVDLRTHFEHASRPYENPLADGAQEVGLDSYHVRRMLHGIAEGTAELLHKPSLPLECNFDMAGAIDFRKGCYIGQELTIRTKHTGLVRKRILPVQLYAGSSIPDGDLPVYNPAALGTTLPPPPSGLEIAKLRGMTGGRSAGRFLAGIGNIGLALCRVEMMTPVSPTGENREFHPDREFTITWDAPAEDGSPSSRTVKIKAFVPPWLQHYIASTRNPPRARDPIREQQRAKELAERLEEEEEEES